MTIRRLAMLGFAVTLEDPAGFWRGALSRCPLLAQSGHL
jgi:hypothetical protein